MADRVKLVERIAARGLRKLEKRRLAAQRPSPEETKRLKALAAARARDAEYEIKRAAVLVEYEAVKARVIERQLRAALKGPPTTEQILAKQRRTANRHGRKERRELRAQERLAEAQERAARMAAKEAIQAEKRAAAAIKRRTTRLPPLPY